MSGALLRVGSILMCLDSAAILERLTTVTGEGCHLLRRIDSNSITNTINVFVYLNSKRRLIGAILMRIADEEARLVVLRKVEQQRIVRAAPNATFRTQPFAHFLVSFLKVNLKLNSRNKNKLRLVWINKAISYFSIKDCPQFRR